jgi:hypothetical protein
VSTDRGSLRTTPIKHSQGRVSSPGSLAIFAAIRRASSRVSIGHRVGLASLITGTPLPVQLLPLSSSRAKQPG